MWILLIPALIGTLGLIVSDLIRVRLVVLVVIWLLFLLLVTRLLSLRLLVLLLNELMERYMLFVDWVSVEGCCGYSLVLLLVWGLSS